MNGSSKALNGGEEEIVVPDYVCCVVTEGVWVWFAAIVLFAVLMFIATMKVSQHTPTEDIERLEKGFGLASHL